MYFLIVYDLADPDDAARDGMLGSFLWNDIDLLPWGQCPTGSYR
jgi:hypothetical protein